MTDLFGKPINAESYFQERLHYYRPLLLERSASLPLIPAHRLPYWRRHDYLLRWHWVSGTIMAIPSKALRELFNREIRTSIQKIGPTTLLVGRELDQVGQVGDVYYNSEVAHRSAI
jgi:hypothetical protein